MKLLGLHGTAGAGKDSAAAGLTDFYPMAFAKPLKDSAKILYDLTDEQLHGKLKEVVDPRWKKSPRVIMQELGDHCRKDNPRFFVTHMKAKIESAIKQGITSIVITDVRYDSEANMIKELGGKIIKINRSFTTTKHTDHSSEQGILDSNVTYTVSNDGTIEDLIEKVKKIGNYGRS